MFFLSSLLVMSLRLPVLRLDEGRSRSSEVLERSIAPAALKSMAQVSIHERPEEVRKDMERERMVDAIREEAASSPSKRASEAFDVAAEVGAETVAEGVIEHCCESSMVIAGIVEREDSGGSDALNQLRIGCLMCAGSEDVFCSEMDHALNVFNFLLSFVKQYPDAVERVAEVMNQLMASPSWSAMLDFSPLKERLRDLPEEIQAALGLQHEKVLGLISPEAQKRAKGGDVPEHLKSVAIKMQSIRPAVRERSAAMPPPPPPPPPKDEWKEAKTPEGHSYYYNLSTRDSTWERPIALGGPHVYTVGKEVEVWSNGMRVWGRGRVEKVDGGKVTAEFALPGRGVAKKELPVAHRDLRPVPSSAHKLTDEEKIAYQCWFDLLSAGSAPGRKPGSVAAAFLTTSGLKRPALKQIWHVANPGSSPVELSIEEFGRCCRLIAHCQAFLRSGGADALLVTEADRPLRVRLREECLAMRPPALPKFEH